VGIRIGNQSSLSAPRIELPFEFAVENGLDAFEWFPDRNSSGAGWTEDDLSEEKRSVIKDTAFAHDIALSVHAPWWANPLANESLVILNKSMRFAQEIGASLFNIHLYRNQGIQHFVQAITPLLDTLALSHITLSIENTPLTGPEDFNELFSELDKAGLLEAGHIGMCLDLGHANLCQATLNDYLKFIDLLDSRIPVVHVHLHENYGDRDSHLTLFTGPSGRDTSGIEGFLRRLHSRCFSACIIFEQWPEPPGLLLDARNKLLAMIGGIWEGSEKSNHDFVQIITEADRQNRSWREKLRWVRDIVCNPKAPPDLDKLAYLAIYLRSIGTGQVPCHEDGRHYRPVHHATLAREIRDSLSMMTGSQQVIVIRKIIPWLPSSGAEFTRAEPLTLIRDIAHRNDIPKELKSEIKHTLQNKLHRCAGPEDLVTSAALLSRIGAPDAGFSPTFVTQFKRFHEQLQEFFGARPLEEQLEAMIKAEPSADAPLIRAFLEAKANADEPARQVEALELLSSLREQFRKKRLEPACAESQDLQLADVRLEEFAFVLLSQLINHLETQDTGIFWSVGLNCLRWAVGNLRCCGFDSDECSAIESELEAWRPSFEPQDLEEVLRLKATLERARRLTEAHRDTILKLFSGKAEKLGHALGIPEEVIRVYAESEIRSHLVFQASRILDLFLKVL